MASKRKFWDIVMNDRIALSGGERERFDLLVYGAVLHCKIPWPQAPKQKRRKKRRNP